MKEAVISAPRYCKYSDYLKKRFGCRVSRISVDAGFTCPNRDGKIGTGGCIYCDNRVFSPNSGQDPRPLEDQIREGIGAAKAKKRAEKFNVYFQAYSNTYADIETLRKRYDVIRKFDEIAMLSIGTRPDCVDEEVLELVSGYAGDYEVWLEYGLQSANDRTLELINRGHSSRDLVNAFRITRRFKGIRICIHVIIGLPFEEENDIMKTAGLLGDLEPDGIKLHPLHIIKGTVLEKLYMDKVFYPPDRERYIDLAVKFLEHLSPQTVIQRMAADCPGKYLAGPAWIADKSSVIRGIEEELAKRDTCQGKKHKCNGN